MNYDKDIRKKFRDYFDEKAHLWHESMSLIPDDPTMLFTTAGMVQFKKHLLGESGKLKRASSIQKCLRTTDIDEVGKTTRHLTFFEMYGNFSFGDYFKREAIAWAWEFLTDHLELDKEKIHATVFETDDEAFALWEEIIPFERIHRLGAEDNFWNMGDTGPCGPCSEILYDRGEEYGCSLPECAPGCECDRYLEVWNLVFAQYDRQKDGSLKDLPKKNIDTGMGLERLNQILMSGDSVFDTPTLKPLIEKAQSEAPKFNLLSAKILADHSRAAAFMIADGLSPSNEGRGYVLRRLLRRAALETRRLGYKEASVWNYASFAIDMMSDFYPLLKKRADHILLVCKKEEEAFYSTIESSGKILNEYISRMKESGQTELSADKVFKLYDTYGLPADITEEILMKESLKMDRKGFEVLLKERSETTDWKTHESKESYYEEIKDLEPTEFVGYTSLSSEARLMKIIDGGKGIVLDKTPFYAEAGGQAGDMGIIQGERGEFMVENTLEEEGVYIHKGSSTGDFKEGDLLRALVDCDSRRASERNHTATHILQSALREILGDHVQQNGSLVGPDRLRFDFTHPEALTDKEIQIIEDRVNAIILKNLPVEADEMSRHQAEKKGALAFFGGKYGERVRAVSLGDAGDISIELCGGTHLRYTGEAGFFKIISESGVAAGVRRIEALTGIKALEYVRKLESLLNDSARLLKTPSEALVERIEKLQEELKDAHHKINSLENKIASGGSAEEKRVTGKDATLIIKEFPSVKAGVMRGWTDRAVNDNSAAAFAYSIADGKVSMILKLPLSLKDKYNAGKIISEIASIVGGKGGGRPDMGQGGGNEPQQIESALIRLQDIFQSGTDVKM